MTRPVDAPVSGGPAPRRGARACLGVADAGLYRDLRDRMEASDILSNALRAGADAPDFLLPDEQAHLVSLSSLLAKGPVVLVFIPGGWCSFCIRKIKALSAALRGRGVSLVILTPETGPYPREMKAEHELDGVVLVDVDYGVGLLLGVVFAPPPAILARMKARGVDLADLHGANPPLLPASAVFVIAAAGAVTMAQLDLDFTTPVAPARILQALDTPP